MASDTNVPCGRCSGKVDHRSQIIKQSGKNTIRRCIHCGYEQPCVEHIVSSQNWDALNFVAKLMGSHNVEPEDREKCHRIRAEAMKLGYIPEGLKGEIRGLQKRYDTAI